jgi:hypothetical protein
MFGGSKKTLTTVEIDALDTTVGSFRLPEKDSMLLLCLIKQLKEDDIFKLVSRYIFSLPNLTAFTAIYNDLAFFPSIGEVTAEDGQSFGWRVNKDDASAGSKPGVYSKTVEEGTDVTVEVDNIGGNGWASVKDRSPGLFGGLFITEWDNWDQIILRTSSRTIKKKFRAHYYGRDFDIPNMGGKNNRDGQKLIKKLSSKLKPGPGQRILPWWRRRRRRSNPFNASGELCEKD